MDTIEISAVLYQEGDCWIAQGLEFDITAQAPSLQEVHQKFVTKVMTEVVISLDLQKNPLEDIREAPIEFWRMYKDAEMTVTAERPPIRITDGASAPRINSTMKIGQLAAA